MLGTLLAWGRRGKLRDLVDFVVTQMLPEVACQIGITVSEWDRYKQIEHGGERAKVRLTEMTSGRLFKPLLYPLLLPADSLQRLRDDMHVKSTNLKIVNLMKSNSHTLIRIIVLWIATFAGLGALTSFAADGTGVITGRILNPETGEYVRNARIVIEETGQSASSGDGGEYRLLAVPAGTVTMTVNYTGYLTAPATLEVVEGVTTTQNFDIYSSEASIDDAGVVKLDKLVVSSAREGNAQAIMEQRNSMNITNTIATDVFGDFPEGNVAEFLRYLPGVQLSNTFGEPRFVNLRGLGSEYNMVTVDGLPMAAADANNGANGRAFSFEMASLSSMDSIEVSKTVSADVDANAPAGTINMRMKRAFDRDGRRISITSNLAMHDSAQSLGRTNGPYDTGETRKIRPGGKFEYSDTFFNRRLGVVLSLNKSDQYGETSRMTHSYNYNTTATDQRYAVMNTIAFLSAPRFYERNTASLTADFRATPDLSLGVKFIYFDSDLWTPQRTVTMSAGTRTAVSGDGLTDMTSATNASISDSGTNYVHKLGESLMIAPSFDWKLGDLTVEGRFAMTDAKSWYDPATKGVIYNPGGLAVPGARFTATRSSVMAHEWQINQISGNDISDAASFPSGTTLSTVDGRSSTQKFYTGKIDVTLPMTLGIPITWKAGGKYSYEGRGYDNIRNLHQYKYTGGGSYWTDKVSEFAFNDSFNGGKITSISGGRIFMPDLSAAYRDFHANPNSYQQTLTAANAYAAWVTNHSRYGEEVGAAYLMGTAQLTPKASLRAGLRYEKTTNIGMEPDSYTSAEVQAAGYAVTASTGVASTVDGVHYQFMSRPWKEKRSSFDNLFPSASFKYEMPYDIDASLGFSTTIRRAPYSVLSGVYLVNDTNQTVRITNADLRPENARNYALRFARYSKSLGMISVSFFENQIEDKFLTTTLTSQEFGNTDPTLDGYDFITTVNSAESTTMRGLELQFSQNLGFLSQQYLKRFNVQGSFTRNYVRNQTITGLVPEIINAGIDFTYWRINVYANANRTADLFNSLGAATRVDKGRTYVSAGGNIRLSKNLRLSLSVRNLTDSPEFFRVEKRGDLPEVLQLFQSNGTTYTVQLKANF